MESSEARRLGDDAFVYLGCTNDDDDVVYWAIDVSEVSELVTELGARHFCFVELRTLMVATDWADSTAMGELAIAGHVSFFSMGYIFILLNGSLRLSKSSHFWTLAVLLMLLMGLLIC